VLKFLLNNYWRELLGELEIKRGLLFTLQCWAKCPITSEIKGASPGKRNVSKNILKDLRKRIP